ncbi:MAG TPA: hypothetical protein VGD57_00430 [Candidatus Dormibacteraeota bacterium]
MRRLLLVVGMTGALAVGGSAAAWADEAPPNQNNYAIAENHRDFSTLVRTSMKIVYVTGDVTAFNAADAEASCVHCKTAAVAIEAIIVIGSPRVYTPQNVAIALNTNCSYCDTAAYAGQFDLQYAGPVKLTERGQEQVENLREQLSSLRHSSLSAMQIAARAAEIRWRLEAVLKNNLVPVNGEGDQPIERDHTSVRAA